MLLFSQSDSQQGTPTSSRKKATPNKRRRCYMCPRIRDRKSQVACDSCGYNICKEHRDPTSVMPILCLNCAGIPGWNIAGGGFDLPTMIPLQGLSPAPTTKKSKKESPKKKEMTGPGLSPSDLPILSPGNLSLMISKVVSLQPEQASQSVSKMELQPPQAAPESESTGVVQLPEVASDVEILPHEEAPPHEAEQKDEVQPPESSAPSEETKPLESDELKTSPVTSPEILDETSREKEDKSPVETQVSESEEIEEIQFTPGTEMGYSI